ncbi:PREDICTED: uncharacterized protein LOC101299814 [Fragaria vesca subsp. vesca]|uniref:uncharacterized protein LOC101299814 n=1 Tax=Fragaria vesca subsp. vesca TaxID=101020 RepID=UPI0002C36E8D|nr:PREDICTED: uncharacterized protein LOC101299814 [Fragaria vesca subsp. vesca]XP_011469738.1 PREDICTED: uncharacterized protein LOC101299814 [Fragaria vesca subsp. vesca]XP_011469739.1 PREDICTED: uncharacterized protein LOC101299814 [Fragaria vesca subsp. vesca]XP_011469740.1 PREDICTED: uncharacterized protein LOC101299814 [Fragaria vesca subsp. vesca]XP_011469741.1 PREDICTED: uncharacterized protein LOC101299814 [Fragaria vesca subsp. vesca]
MSPSRLEQQKAPNVVSSPGKTKGLLVRCMRVGLVLCLIASISFALSSAFPNRTLTSISSFSTTEPATNISHLLFGLGSSVDTWRGRSNLTETWWNTTTTRGYVWLDTKPESSLLDVLSCIPYRVSENWTGFRYSHSQAEVRIARIVVDSFNLRLPDVRWFVMGDDDTVFFPENLASVLSGYDHNQMYYIGGNSESVDQNEMHAYDMAFGGGGFAVSYPLAARLAEQMDGCLDRYFNMYGSDQRVWACMIEIGVPLTKLSGFHQFDIRADSYGILAAHPLAPLLSLHHIDALDPIFPTQTQLESVKSLVQAYRVDPPRILQQNFCYDRRRRWTVSISWGFTVQIYPFLLSALELQTPLRTFKTWRKRENGPFTFNTRAVSSDPCEQPITYFLEDVKVDGKSGNTSTTYKRFDDKDGKVWNTLNAYERLVGRKAKKCKRADYVDAMATERIVVVSTKMDPQYWAQAPRRQCSEIEDHESTSDGTMLIRLRRCRPSESITLEG